MNALGEVPVVFACKDVALTGIVHRGAAPGSRVGVLVVVGGPQYRVGSHRQFVIMARDLASSGFPVMRFDYRGMGDGGGDPVTFESVEQDVSAAVAAFLRAVPDLRRIVLWGLCDAASAILMNPTPAEVCGKVVVNPYVRTEASEARATVRHYYLLRIAQRDFWRKLLRGSVDVRAAVIQFAASLRRAITPSRDSVVANVSFIDRMLTGVCRFEGPTFVALSGRDLTAREFEALADGDAEWREALGTPRVTRSRFDDADHTFSDRRQLDSLTQATLRWLRGLEGVAA